MKCRRSEGFNGMLCFAEAPLSPDGKIQFVCNRDAGHTGVHESVYCRGGKKEMLNIRWVISGFTLTGPGFFSPVHKVYDEV